MPLQTTLSVILIVCILSLVGITIVIVLNYLRYRQDKEDFESYERLSDKDAYIGYLNSILEDIKDAVANPSPHRDTTEKVIERISNIIELDLQDEYEYVAHKRNDRNSM